MSKTLFILPAAAIVMLGACTTTGNTERGAVIGASAGAVIGAIIGNNTGSGDAETGAAIGAVVGGAGGAYAGSQKDKTMHYPPQTRRGSNGQTLYFDQQTGRYFYVDSRTGKTYFENGDFRS